MLSSAIMVGHVPDFVGKVKSFIGPHDIYSMSALPFTINRLIM